MSKVIHRGLEDTPINRAALELISEFDQQEKKGHYKIHRLRKLLNALRVVMRKEDESLILKPSR